MRKSILLSMTLCLCIAMQAQNKSTVNTGNNPSAQNSVEIEKDAKPQEYNRMIFGQFIEHFHSQIYGGLVPETGKTVSCSLLDKHGFRKDVIEALKELKIPIVRKIVIFAT